MNIWPPKLCRVFGMPQIPCGSPGLRFQTSCRKIRGHFAYQAYPLPKHVEPEKGPFACKTTILWRAPSMSFHVHLGQGSVTVLFQRAPCFRLRVALGERRCSTEPNSCRLADVLAVRLSLSNLIAQRVQWECPYGIRIQKPYGCFYKLVVHFLGVPKRRALLFWLYTRAPIFWLPKMIWLLRPSSILP